MASQCQRASRLGQASRTRFAYSSAAASRNGFKSPGGGGSAPRHLPLPCVPAVEKSRLGPMGGSSDLNERTVGSATAIRRACDLDPARADPVCGSSKESTQHILCRSDRPARGCRHSGHLGQVLRHHGEAPSALRSKEKTPARRPGLGIGARGQAIFQCYNQNPALCILPLEYDRQMASVATRRPCLEKAALQCFPTGLTQAVQPAVACRTSLDGLRPPTPVYMAGSVPAACPRDNLQ
jgi:hypothetical protein